ncbi:MAG: hypothetical protein IPK80_26830 [Nannocystis sp.]|nr:hypothetical protein [Nannocystis sp.]
MSGERASAAIRAAAMKTRRLLAQHGYLVLAAAGALVVTRTVDFAPPEKVRAAPAAAIGEAAAHQTAPSRPAPSSELRGLSTAEAVQVRATLRLIEDPQAQRVGAAEVPSRVLAQPVVATMIGIPASVDHKVRFDDGALEVVIELRITPRAEPGGLVVEEDVRVLSRRSRRWDSGELEERLHLESHGEVVKVEARGRRWIFAVDERLFQLDVDVSRAS